MIEFDFKYNPFDAKTRMKAIVDQINKAYIWLSENVAISQQVQSDTANTVIGSNLNKVPVMDITLEVTADELRFIRDALRNQYNREF